MAGFIGAGPSVSPRQPHRLFAPRFFFLGLAVMLISAAWLTGCAEETQAPDFSSPEMLGYIARGETDGRLMVTSAGGGAGESLLQWQGYGERFSFSNDGRFFSLVMLPQASGASRDPLRTHVLVAATDGSVARNFSSSHTLLAFSPDSKKLAYASYPVAGDNEVGVIDIGTGEIEPLVQGKMLLDPVWVDDRTLLYAQYQSVDYPSRADGGIIYRLDVESAATVRMTPPGRTFSAYNSPVSFIQPRVALTEKSPLQNLWSLEISSGDLRQITNNTLYQFRAGYLPGGNTILFEQQKSREDSMSSEVAMISDDGGGFSMLTADFYFDGVHSFSPTSGRMTYQKSTDKGDTSIWLAEADGTGSAMVHSSGRREWIGDPNFISGTGWLHKNPLKMTVRTGAPDQPLAVTIENPSADAVTAVLRAFPGIDLELDTDDLPAGVEAGSSSADQTQTVNGAGPAAPLLGSSGAADQVFNVSLEPGRSVTINLLPKVRPTFAASTETTLLLTLAVPETPPRMYWQDFG